MSEPDFSDEEIRRYFGQTCAFERGVVAMSDLMDADRPEIAFAGRSNVGKSTLVNAVAGRRALARASSEPGRTRELNFFALGEKLRIVDLPGYGYAKAPKAAIERWTKLTRDYLRGRPGLVRVFLLIDSRHGIMANDLAVMTTLDEAAVVYQVVLTKGDKLKPPERDRRLGETAAALSRRPAAHPHIHLVAAQTGEGVPALRMEIMRLAGETPQGAAMTG